MHRILPLLAIVFIASALAASRAHAREPNFITEFEIGAEFEIGFGWARQESEGKEGPASASEVTLKFSGNICPKSGDEEKCSEKNRTFSGKVEITVADSENQFDSAEHELVWYPAENLSITISGAALEFAATDGNIDVVNAAGGPVGDEEVNLDFTGVGLLNVTYIGSGWEFGVAILDRCVPECGYGLDSTEADPIHPDIDVMTTVVHLKGAAGAMKYNAYLARSSGIFSPSSQDGSGMGGGAGMVIETGGFRAALDISKSTIECSANAGDTSCTDDNEQSKAGFSVNFGGFGLHNFLGVDKTGAAETETSNIDVVYLIDVGDAVVGPEYRTTRIEPLGGEATTDTFLLFGMSIEF